MEKRAEDFTGCLIKPKVEIQDDLDDITNDKEDFIVPKEELPSSSLHWNTADLDEPTTNLFQPIKTETTLSTEIVQLQKGLTSSENGETFIDSDVSSGITTIVIKREPDDEESVSADCSTILGPRLSKKRLKTQRVSQLTPSHNVADTEFDDTCKPIAHSKPPNAEESSAPELRQVGSASRTDKKPHKCSLCYMKFAHKSRLSAHMLTHTGVKPFDCSLCELKFAHKNGLTVHMRTHTGERPYECQYCDMKFAQRGSLTYHTRTHTGEKPFDCNVCDMKFARKNCLADHLLTHTGEKRYECDLCYKKFVRKCRFTAHRLTHTARCDTKLEDNQNEPLDETADPLRLPDEFNLCYVKKEWEVPIL